MKMSQTVSPTLWINSHQQARTLWAVPDGLRLGELTPADGRKNQTLVYMNPVPEPASMAILGSAMIMLGYVRKQRQIGQVDC
jgi:hypothetical protein